MLVDLIQWDLSCVLGQLACILKSLTTIDNVHYSRKKFFSPLETIHYL